MINHHRNSRDRDADPRWVPVWDAEYHLGMSERNVRRLISGGDLRAAKVGNRLRIDRSSLTELLRSRGSTTTEHRQPNLLARLGEELFGPWS